MLYNCNMHGTTCNVHHAHALRCSSVRAPRTHAVTPAATAATVAPVGFRPVRSGRVSTTAVDDIHSAADIHSLRYATPDDIDEADLEDELNALEAEMVHYSALRDR